MKNHKLFPILILSILTLILSIGYRFYNQLNVHILKTVLIILIVIFFVVLFGFSIFYFIKNLKLNRLLSFIPLISIILSTITLIWPKTDLEEKVNDRFFNVDAVLLNYDSLYINSYHFEEMIGYKGTPYHIPHWYSCL
jgi:hypothetical protein